MVQEGGLPTEAYIRVSCLDLQRLHTTEAKAG